MKESLREELSRERVASGEREKSEEGAYVSCEVSHEAGEGRLKGKAQCRDSETSKILPAKNSSSPL